MSEVNDCSRCLEARGYLSASCCISNRPSIPLWQQYGLHNAAFYISLFHNLTKMFMYLVIASPPKALCGTPLPPNNIRLPGTLRRLPNPSCRSTPPRSPLARPVEFLALCLACSHSPLSCLPRPSRPRPRPHKRTLARTLRRRHHSRHHHLRLCCGLRSAFVCPRFSLPPQLLPCQAPRLLNPARAAMTIRTAAAAAAAARVVTRRATASIVRRCCRLCPRWCLSCWRPPSPA